MNKLQALNRERAIRSWRGKCVREGFGSVVRRVVSDYPLSLAAVTALLLSLLLLAPALNSRALLFGTDTVTHDYIVLLYGWSQILNSGRMPLWSPHLFCGLPLLATFAFCPFYPTQILFALAPFNVAFTFQYVFAFVLTGWAGALWARALGRSGYAAILAAIASVVSGHILTLAYAGHLQKLIAIAWAPVAFACASSLVRSAAPRYVAGLACALGMQLLASHSQIAYATLIVSLLIVACGVVCDLGSSDSRSRRTVYRTTFGVVGALFTACMLAGIQIFPGWELAGRSNRAAGVSFAEATATSYPPRELLEFAFSRLYGDSVRGTSSPYFGEWGERIVSDFVGIPWLLLVLLALVLKHDRRRWSLALLVAGSLIVGLGRYTPIYRVLYEVLPGFGKFRSPGTFMFLADLALVQLAAMGFDALRELGVDTLRQRQLRTVGLMAGVAAITCLVLIGFAPLVARTIAPAAGHAQISVVVRALRVGALEGVVAAVLLGVLWAAATLRLTWLWRSAVAGMALLTVAIPLAHNRHFLQFEPLAPYLTFLERQPQYAVAKRLEASPLPRLLQDNPLKNDGILHDVGVPTGYHPVIPGRYARLLEHVGYDSALLCRLFAVNLAALRPPAVPREAEAWARSVSASPFQMWSLRVPGALLRATTSPLVVRDDIAAARVVKDANTSFPVVVEEKHASLLAPVTAASSGNSSTNARILQYRAGRIEFLVEGATPALVVVAESFAPGWRARTSAGTSCPVIPVNIAQCGVVVVTPAHVVLSYEPYSYRLGLFSTLAVSGILLVCAATTRSFRHAQHRSHGAFTTIRPGGRIDQPNRT